MKNDAVMIISGYNTRAIIAFCRWADKNNINFHIISNGKNDPIQLTKYNKKIFICRSNKELESIEIKKWSDSLIEKHKYRKIIILPSTEFLNRFILRNRDKIESEQLTIPLTNENIYTKISNKHSFTKICNAHKLSTPKEITPSESRIPFVAKPKSYSGLEEKTLKPHLILTKTDYINFLNNENIDNFFFQEFIFGKSIYIFIYINRNNKKIIKFSQENLIQQENGGSIILAKKSKTHEKKITSKYIKMLKKENFSGLIMIELRLNLDDKKYYMIEANPRPWGPIQFCTSNNIDFFTPLLKDYKFNLPPIKKNKTKPKYYFWSGGMKSCINPAFHGTYTKSKFKTDYNIIIKNDIFLEEDTIHLYLNELKTHE